MKKVYFAKAVRYKGVRYNPNVQFDVDDKDVEELKKAGAWIVEPKQVAKPAPVVAPAKPGPKPKVEPKPAEPQGSKDVEAE